MERNADGSVLLTRQEAVLVAAYISDAYHHNRINRDRIIMGTGVSVQMFDEAQEGRKRLVLKLRPDLEESMI